MPDTQPLTDEQIDDFETEMRKQFITSHPGLMLNLSMLCAAVKQLRVDLHRAEHDAEVETRRGDNWERRAKQLGRENEALEAQCNGLRGRSAELHNRISERNDRIVELQSQLEQLRAENQALTKSLRNAYEFYMGPQACGDFTCTCDQPKLCGICEIREATELVLADDLLATSPVVNCNPPEKLT